MTGSLSTEVAEAVRLRDAATPGPWTTDVVAAATGLEHTSYAHQVKIGIHSYTVAHRKCQNWTSIIYGHESQRGEGKLEHDVSIHPDAALIAAAPSHVDLIERLFAEIERLTACLQKANANHEHFEREWYLRGDEIERLEAELEQARADYDGVVTKFDNCRAALASRYKADTGNEPNPPDEYEGDWHEWLIEQSEKAALKP